MERKLVVVALGSFGFGSVVGWAITTNVYNKRFNQQEEDLNSLSKKIDYILATPKNDDRFYNDPSQITTDEIIETANEEEIENVIPEGETHEETRSNLQRLIDNYAADPEAQEFANMESQPVKIDNTPPFVIPQSIYAWDEDGEHFAKITLTYFPRDRVLLDDDDDPIDDVADLVGWRNLSKFGGESEDPNVVFIRNNRMQTDFEVIKEDENPLPLHVKYGMEKEEFRANKAAGLIKLRQEDDDH